MADRPKDRERGRKPTPIDRESAPAPVAPAPVAPAVVESINRVSIPLNDNGSIAWERMRESTRDAVKKLMAENVGAIAAPSPTASAFDPMIVGTLYDALGVLASNIAYLTGHTPESSKGMLFTSDEKAQLLAPTQRVLDKYAGALSRYQDEITLAMLLGVMVQGKIKALEKTGAPTQRTFTFTDQQQVTG